MKSGYELRCKLNFKFKNSIFEKGDRHKIIFIDNESVEILICIDKKEENNYIVLPLSLVYKKFETNSHF